MAKESLSSGGLLPQIVCAGAWMTRVVYISLCEGEKDGQKSAPSASITSRPLPVTSRSLLSPGFTTTATVKMKFLAVLSLAAAASAIPVSDCKANASAAEVQCMADCGWGWRCSTGCALSKVDDFIQCELDEQATANSTTIQARDAACSERVAQEEAACINACDGAGLCAARW